ncbi:MAG TPA: PQQ-binding-like beta-propeller repeat protein [Verrucomicrobiae bacterium]
MTVPSGRNTIVPMFGRALSAFVLTLVLWLGFATAQSADWPQFRGPDGQGHAVVRGIPTEWGRTNIVWQVEVPGNGWSSPILQRDRIFLTTATPADGDKQSLGVFCFDTHSGKTLWSTELFSAVPQAGHKKNSHASATPIADGERIYAHFGPYGTAALDLNGKVLWRNTALKYSSVHGNGGSPILVNDALIFSCDGASDPFVVALDKANGEVLWKTARTTEPKKTFSFSTPLAIEINGQTQVVSPTSGGVMAYDPGNGKEIWRVRYPEGYSVVPRPVFGHGLVFVSSAFDRPVLYAIRPDGKGDVTDTHIAWSISKGAPNTPSPLLVDGEIYFVSDAGIMTCADAKTGTIHWQERVGGNYSTSPVFAAGRIFLQSEEGMGTVLKPGKAFEVLAKNDLKERTLASYAVDEGVIYIRGAEHLFCVQQPVAVPLSK